MEFATSKNQYAGSDRETILIGACDGKTRERTLEHQLIRNGIIDGKWSHAGDETPGSIFFWFKHVAAGIYEPDYMELDSIDTNHCGICYHDIEYVYHFISDGMHKLNLTRDMDVVMPATIVSGSECIHLGDEMLRLREWLFRHGLVQKVMKFTRSRIDVQCIIDCWQTWDRDVVALPLRWFYFRPDIRQAMARGESFGRGRHIFGAYAGDSLPRKMNMAAKETGYIRAKDIFSGRDDYTGRVVDINCDGQSSHPCAYAKLYRDQAMELATPLS